MPSTSACACGTAPIASSAKRASTPARSADAVATGMRCITRSNARVEPAALISSARTTNAPNASGTVTSEVPAGSAARASTPH